MIPKLDPTRLTPEQRDKLDSYNQTQKQIQTMSDIAAMVQELVEIADESKKNTDQLQALGAVLTDAREQLIKLNEKEAPEAPDYAKPVVEAVSRLETALKAVKVSPVVNVGSPNVEVAPPDLTEFNKILRDEIPKAFASAMKAMPPVEIPKTDFAPLLKAWEGISEQLVSLENATRMKPLPGSVVVSNFNDMPLAQDPVLAVRLDNSADPVLYLGKAPIGTSTSAASWQVAKLDTTAGLIKTWAFGSSEFNQIWDDRTSLTYY